ncbi:MAG: bifunctional [glutamate--ammonia ligase]-adenylyl-L-tyrosine phosphorylase/[glutamate--ammonia-ligase] adenylyltransferase [Verrucomicrobia bacterium]|jgi:glutamate-ammonia-ligase adenylyltransferase|nr:bifunctional [glutamate--ammonia ligase]-adenylyl-L-tyrosine phosphorylase/[glutamate--ammonia-ligase] adenylyltransferase [Verrucomicrobiota bacterium]
MNAEGWNKAVAASADPVSARERLERLRQGGAEASDFIEAASTETAAILCAVLAGSEFLSDLLVSRPEWLLVLDGETARYGRRGQGLQKEVKTWLDPLLNAADFATALRRVREFKQREMVRIAARDLARLARTEEITRELSDVADVCLDTVWRVCRLQLEARLGCPYQEAGSGQWQRTQSCVFGMGKLGGQELNYSSDVDVLFVYDEEGSVFREPPARKRTPRATLTSHEFFNRLGEAFITEVSRTTEQGFLYRIDLRLRPEGSSGPLTRSLAGYENYYAQWGQTWERLMLIKARRVAGDNDVAGEFLEMVQPFRFPRAISEGALREVRELKQRIETEVVRSGEVDRNVKLGRGGIREIEFVVQSLQVLHAGRQPFLQNSQTLPCLDKLAQYNLLPKTDTTRLAEAYCFLRDVEHRLQMQANQQTHTIPDAKPARERLARLMTFRTLKAFETALTGHRAFVRSVFDRLLNHQKAKADDALPASFEGQEPRWKQLLAEHLFRDPVKAVRVLREFVEGPGYVHTSPRTISLARQLVPKLFAYCRRQDERWEGDRITRPVLSDPDRVLVRLDSFIATYGARATLFELWARYPLVFEALMLLFDRSEFLAELAIRTPDIVDDLVVSGRLRQKRSAPDVLRDLQHGIRDADQHGWIRTYQQAELMRLGCRDILEIVGPQQALEGLSDLADACLQYALAVVMRRHRLKEPPFALLGLGKLGGRELNYGSDLDILFVADDRTRNRPKLQKMAAELMDLLSGRTELGIAFVTDARLRPDGETGMLVNTLSAHEAYYRERAQLWEIQSLSRVRFIAGDAELGTRYVGLIQRLSNFAEPSRPLAAHGPDWKTRIHDMRMRIQKERTPAGQDALAIKTGRGGLMDAEFVAQALCLEHGWYEPNTLGVLERAQARKLLPEAEALITNYLRLRRVETILRRWSYEGETVLPVDPAPYDRVSVRCGYVTPKAFEHALAGCRQAIRSAYEAYFLTPSHERRGRKR